MKTKHNSKDFKRTKEVLTVRLQISITIDKVGQYTIQIWKIQKQNEHKSKTQSQY